MVILQSVKTMEHGRRWWRQHVSHLEGGKAPDYLLQPPKDQVDLAARSRSRYDKKYRNPVLPKGFDFQTGGAVSGERVLKQAEGGRRSRSINRILKFDSTSHDEVTAIINVGIAANRGNPELITQHG
jgi:hypothetical protein